VKIALEAEASGGERPDSHFFLQSGRNHLFDGRRVHFKLVGRVVHILHVDQERLGVRHMDFRRREAVVLRGQRIGLQVLRTGGADKNNGKRRARSADGDKGFHVCGLGRAAPRTDPGAGANAQSIRPSSNRHEMAMSMKMAVIWICSKVARFRRR
jgi:hypothetical protein